MDPNANLEEQRELAKEMDQYDRDDAQLVDKANRLAELVQALDQWILGGGFLPRDWDIRSRG